MTFTGTVDWNSEDSGCALIASIEADNDTSKVDGMYVELHSWDLRRIHKDANTLAGKKVRVTVEVLP